MIHVVFISCVLALIAFASPALATDRTAASCNATDVQAAMNAAVDGDRVIVPSGTCTWTGQLIIRKAIELTGSGSLPGIGAAVTAGTTINVNGAAAGCSICIYEATTGNVIISNLRFVVSSTATVPTYGVILWNFNETNPSAGRLVIVHHITMEYHQGTERSVRVGTGRGVMYRNIFTNDQQPQNGIPGNSGPTIQCKMNSPAADTNWASPSTFGVGDSDGNKNLYIETSTFLNHGAVVDVDDGCRVVVRFNTFTDATLGDHGHDTSIVGIRHVEIYNNTFQCVNDWNFTAWYGSRGGTWVITDNVMPNNCYGRKVTRVGATVQKLRRNDTQFGGTDCYPGPYPWLRQEGYGWAGSGGINNQTLEPIYIWNNKNSATGTPGEADELVPYDVVFVPSCSFDNSSQTTAGYIRQNRDFYLSIAKPGYAKFTYPHPAANVMGGQIIAPGGFNVR